MYDVTHKITARNGFNGAMAQQNNASRARKLRKHPGPPTQRLAMVGCSANASSNLIATTFMHSYVRVICGVSCVVVVA